MNSERFQGLIKIGLRIRESRRQRGLSLEEVAQRAGVTKSLLSKIENFRAVPSLPVLVRVASGLNVDMAELVKGIGGEKQEPYTLIKSSQRQQVDRDGAIGFLYEVITSRQMGDYTFDSVILTLEPNSKRKSVTTEGYEFVYILEGSVKFAVGPDELYLEQGDALFFNGRIPHLPRNTDNQKAKILAIYLIDNNLKL